MHGSLAGWSNIFDCGMACDVRERLRGLGSGYVLSFHVNLLCSL